MVAASTRARVRKNLSESESGEIFFELPEERESFCGCEEGTYAAEIDPATRSKATREPTTETKTALVFAVGERVDGSGVGGEGMKEDVEEVMLGKRGEGGGGWRGKERKKSNK